MIDVQIKNEFIWFFDKELIRKNIKRLNFYETGQHFTVL